MSLLDLVQKHSPVELLTVTYIEFYYTPFRWIVFVWLKIIVCFWPTLHLLVILWLFDVANAETIITADQAVRGGKVSDLKTMVDKAVASSPCVKRVFVASRTGADVPMGEIDFPLEKVLTVVYCFSEHSIIFLSCSWKDHLKEGESVIDSRSWRGMIAPWIKNPRDLSQEKAWWEKKSTEGMFYVHHIQK